MSNDVNYEIDHYCPVYNKIIDADLCYDSMMCLNRSFKISSTKELSAIKDIEAAREICIKCKYAGL